MKQYGGKYDDKHIGCVKFISKGFLPIEEEPILKGKRMPILIDRFVKSKMDFSGLKMSFLTKV